MVSIAPNQTLYEHQDTIVVDLQASATGLTIDMDFSAIDSGYTSGAETVTDLGAGLYRVSYTLSSGNTRAGGCHRVPYAVHDTSGNEVSAALTLTYVPDGLMDHVIEGGSYSPKPTRAWTVDAQAVTLVSITDTQIDVEPDPLDDEHPDFSTGATGHTRGGRVFELDIETEGRAPTSLFAIVEDPNRTGQITVPLSPTSTNCTATECTYTAPIVIGARQPGAGVGATSLTLSIVTLEGLGTAGDLWVQPAFPIPTATYLVKGKVTYNPTPAKPNCNGTLPQEPYSCEADWPTEEGQPAAGMLVRVVTTCPGEHYTWIDEAGEFELWFTMPTECADEPAMLRVSSLASPARRVAVFDRAPGEVNQFSTKDALKQALSTNGLHYRIYSQYVVVDGAQSTTFIPEDDALTSDPLVLNDIVIDDPPVKIAIHLAIEARKAHDYFLPWLGNKLATFNILADFDELVGTNNNDNASFFAPHIHDGFGHISPLSKWSNFVVAHEYSHYLHHHFGIDQSAYYGRFSEPMADAQAATIVGEVHIAPSGLQNTVNIDFNGAKDENGVVSQPSMHFYASPNDPNIPPSPACHDVDDHYCCDGNKNGAVDGAADIRACMMVEDMGWYKAIFYDLSDGIGNEPEDYGQGNFDQVDGHGASPDPLDHALMDVVLNYMGGGLWPDNQAYVDRGIPHTDVVDVLDGMMCRGHMTKADAEVLLHDVMNFEYDFFPPVGACP